MKNKYLFYYDESGHSRRITRNTIFSDNYADYFVATIIGYNARYKDKVEQDYILLEKKYEEYYQVRELKSSIFGRRKFKYGLASFKNKDLEFLRDYLCFLIKHKITIYFSAINKIEFIVSQLLRDYKNSFFIDSNALKYSITKLITLYRPKDVMNAMYNGNSFSNELKTFLEKLLTNNKGRVHKELENNAISEALIILNKNKPFKCIDWDYTIAFKGFRKFLEEQNIKTDSIVIDKEGDGRTWRAACKCGFSKSIEAKSDKTPGVRMADMLCGVINGFLASFVETFKYKNLEEAHEKSLLDIRWFNSTAFQIECYKKLKIVLIDQNQCWNKAFCSNYSDAVAFFLCLLNYESAKEEIDNGRDNKMDPEYFNTYVCETLERRFLLMNYQFYKSSNS